MKSTSHRRRASTKDRSGAKIEPVGSSALALWTGTSAARLNELELVHEGFSGATPGRKWGTQQLNLSMFLALCAQFQTYCRALHDEAVSVHVAHARAEQQSMLRLLLTQGRKLDAGNARTDSLGSDFNRLGFELIPRLKGAGVATERRLGKLDSLVDIRNKIAHGDETSAVALARTAGITLSKDGYLRLRRALDLLASTMDRVVADQLAIVLEEARPW